MKKRSEKQEDLDKLKTELANGFDRDPFDVSGHHGGRRQQAAPRREAGGRTLSES